MAPEPAASTSKAALRTLAIAQATQILTGSLYAFSAYSNVLKMAYQLDQTTLQSFIAVGQMGGLTLAVPFGWIYNRIGPRVMGSIGAACSILGNAVVAILSAHYAADPAPAGIGLRMVLYAMFFAMGSGSVICDVAAVTCNQFNFPAQQGDVVGSLKAGLGLSSAFMVVVFNGFFINASPLAVLWQYCAGGVAALLLFQMVQGGQAHGSTAQAGPDLPVRWIRWPQAGSAALAAISGIAAGTAALRDGWSSRAQDGWAIGMACIALAIPAVAYGSLLFRDPGKATGLAAQGVNAPRSSSDSDADVEQSVLLLAESGDATPRMLVLHDLKPEGTDAIDTALTPPEPWACQLAVRDPPTSFLSAVLSVECGVLATALMAGIGAGFMFINNIGQMSEAANAGQHDTYALVKLAGVGSCIGRLLGGGLGDWLARRAPSGPTPCTLLRIRVAMLAAVLLIEACCLAVVGMLISEATLYVCVPIIGIAFGAQWSLLPALVSVLFVPQLRALFYALLGCGTGVAGLLASTVLSGNVYRVHASLHANGHTECYGTSCFQWALLPAAMWCAAAAVLTLVIQVKYRSS